MLPLSRRGGGAGRVWQSEKWAMRRDRISLVPGDSTIGVRLPLASLPYVPPEEIEEEVEPDSMAPAPDFPAYDALPGPGTTVPGRGVRTALTVQARAGLLYIYIPPLPRAEDWIALVAAIEQTAAAAGRPVVLEGYKAPFDRRTQAFSVTPDPGVIEVNIHPAESWRDLITRTVELYDEARAAGLRAEKFMLDGRHVGTGRRQPCGDGGGDAGG